MESTTNLRGASREGEAIFGHLHDGLLYLFLRVRFAESLQSVCEFGAAPSSTGRCLPQEMYGSEEFQSFRQLRGMKVRKMVPKLSNALLRHVIEPPTLGFVRSGTACRDNCKSVSCQVGGIGAAQVPPETVAKLHPRFLGQIDGFFQCQC